MKNATERTTKPPEIIVRKATPILLALVLVCLFVETAEAQIASDNVLNGIVNEFRDKSATWSATLLGHALALFWILAGIDFAWTAITLAFRNADLQEWTAEIIKRVLFIGLFLAILLNGSAWTADIVSSFRQAADGANAAAGGTTGLSPSTIFDVGLTLASKIYSELSLFDPIRSVGLHLAALSIGAVFALIAAFLMVALVEMYIVLNAGIILLGFGGSQWTKDFVVQFLKYAVSVGVKLFILQLIVGLGEAFILGWLGDFSGKSYHEVTVLLGSSIFLLVVVWMVPGIVQSIITGTSYSSGAAMMGAAAGMMSAATVMGAAASKMAGTVKGGAGAASAVSEAVKLSQTQLSGGGAGAKPSLSAVAKQAASNLGQAGVEEARRKVRGFHAANERRGGTLGGRMASNMEEKRLSMQADASPSGGGSSSGNSSSSPAGGGTIRAGAAANDPGTDSGTKAG